MLDLIYSRLIDRMFKSFKLFSSLDSEIPLWFASIHTFNFAKTKSLLLITLSLLSSNSERTSKPDVEVNPFLRITLSPNNSLPLSIFPLLLRSSARKPSTVPIHDVFSANPLLSRSKNTPLSIECNSISELLNLIISGSLGGASVAALL